MNALPSLACSPSRFLAFAAGAAAGIVIGVPAAMLVGSLLGISRPDVSMALAN